MDENDLRRTKIDLTFEISFSGASAIGAGVPRGNIQRTILRSLDGLPYLPGSSIKGRVREFAERLAGTLGHDNICGSPNPETMCGNTKAFDRRCIVCRTFGTPGASSNSGETGLIWRDAPLIERLRPEASGAGTDDYVYARTQVQLSRLRGVALEKRLFTSENTLEELSYKARVRGWLPASLPDKPFPDELLLLCAAIKLLRFVGGGKSRGLGRCLVKTPKSLNMNDVETPWISILEKISELDIQDKQNG